MPTDRPIVIYDSECVLCSRAVRFVLRHEVDSLVVFTDFQSQIASSLGVESKSPNTVLFYQDGQVLDKSHAAFAIAKHLKMPWRWIAYFSFLPKSLTDGIYDVIGKNRYRLFGKEEDSCQLSQELSQRYIT